MDIEICTKMGNESFVQLLAASKITEVKERENVTGKWHYMYVYFTYRQKRYVAHGCGENLDYGNWNLSWEINPSQLSKKSNRTMSHGMMVVQEYIDHAVGSDQVWRETSSTRNKSLGILRSMLVEMSDEDSVAADERFGEINFGEYLDDE